VLREHGESVERALRASREPRESRESRELREPRKLREPRVSIWAETMART
jgi:hypothetical protein